MDRDEVLRLIRDVADEVINPRFRDLGEGDVEEKNPGDLVTVADHEAERLLYAGLGTDNDTGVDQYLHRRCSRWMTRAQRLTRFRAAVALDPAQCAGLVAWELEPSERSRVRELLTQRKLLVGGTESYSGFFGIPEDRPRRLFIANAGLFTAPADVERLADAIEEAAARSG